MADRGGRYIASVWYVAAKVTVPTSLSYRYAGADEFVLNAETFIRDTGTDSVMLYGFDTADDEATGAMEDFLADYTKTVNARLDYESKATYQAQFEGFRSMFLLLLPVFILLGGAPPLAVYRRFRVSPSWNGCGRRRRKRKNC